MLKAPPPPPSLLSRSPSLRERPLSNYLKLAEPSFRIFCSSSLIKCLCMSMSQHWLLIEWCVVIPVTIWCCSTGLMFRWLLLVGGNFIWEWNDKFPFSTPFRKTICFLQVITERHSRAKGEEECLCTFILVWQHGPGAGIMMEKKIENICLVQSKEKPDRNVALFLERAKEKIVSTTARFQLLSSICHITSFGGNACNKENSS